MSVDNSENVETASQTTVEAVIDDALADRPADISPLALDSGMTAESGAASGEPQNDSPEVPKRGRGRPKKQKQFSGERPEINGRPRAKPEAARASEAPAIDPEQAGIEPAAQLCVMMVNSSGMMLGGEEAAMREHEIELSKNAFVAYFQAKGIDAIPAWAILAGGLCPYYMRVLTQTPARSTVPSLFRKAWFGVKEFWRKKRDARANRWNDRQRENNHSDTASQ
jgi:hypothetical protein